MGNFIDLPELPQGITPQWLSQALQAAGHLPDASAVVSLSQDVVGDGTGMMAGLARLRVTYEGEQGDLPDSFVAKFPSDNETNREVANSYRLYERETRYYRELDALTTAVAPRTYLTLLEDQNFLILMEDLEHYRVGDQQAGADLDDTLLMADELAKLHAAFWGRVDELDWVPHIAHSYHADNMDMLVRIGWPNMCEVFAEAIDPAHAAMGDQLIEALPTLQQWMDHAPVTLLHGDFRMENVFFGVDAGQLPIAIADWQGPLLGRGMVDVALMLAQSTRTSVRQAHEREVIARYTERLATLGVPDYGYEEAWQDYRRSVLYNWIYVGVVAGTLDVSNRKAFAWMSKMVARQSVASNDLDVFSLLP